MLLLLLSLLSLLLLSSSLSTSTSKFSSGRKTTFSSLFLNGTAYSDRDSNTFTSVVVFGLIFFMIGQLH